MSRAYDLAKKNYEKGFWKDCMIAELVGKGILTTSQYEEITGEAYEQS